MRQQERQRRADEAALAAYARARLAGAPHERAFSVAILGWLSLCSWADGRQARARVREVLLKTRAMGPSDYEDWVILASGDDVWGAGASIAIHRLSLDCRTLDMREAAERHDGYEAGAEAVRDDPRADLPKEVSRLKRLARELLPADAAREDA